jgi:uncharacterized protein (TIGR02145 family)
MKHILQLTCVAIILVLTACKKDCPEEQDLILIDNGGILVDSLDLGAARTVDVLGIVRDEDGNAIAGAFVQSGYGTQQTTTDARGFFRFEGLNCFEKNAYVRVSKAGYFEGSRSWIPTSGGYNRIEIHMLEKNSAGGFDAASGGSVQLETFSLSFPANAIVNGTMPYNGTVTVLLNAIDATDLFGMSAQMPGSLTGWNNGTLMPLRSIGMSAIELQGSNGESLQLASGMNAEIRCQIPASLSGIATQSIPLWSFDEATGIWKYEGSAERVGNEYVGNASHFSYWNFDLVSAGVNYTVTVNYNEFPIGFYPLDNAVLMLSGASIGTIPGTTGTNGMVTGLVPANETMLLQVLLPCSNGFQEVYSETVGPFSADVSQTINIDALPYLTTISGTMTNCDGMPSNGYVWLNDNGVVLAENGSFQMTVCTGNNELSAYCFSGGQAGNGYISDLNLAPGLATVSVVCEDCFPIGAPGSGVTDIDGNNYPTVINGTHEWMAANLMTTHYSNGDAIPEVTDNAQWSANTTPAWCYFENNAANNVIFGKLYNGYAMEDSRNVCPTGWHVPSNDEWEILMNTLGGSAVAASAMRTTGNIGEGTGLWPFDNVISNNVSGFSAQPAQFRNLDGTFPTQVTSTIWWTSTLTANDTYFTRSIYSFSNSVFNQDFTRPQGFSVRCLRD